MTHGFLVYNTKSKDLTPKVKQENLDKWTNS